MCYFITLSVKATLVKKVSSFIYSQFLNPPQGSNYTDPFPENARESTDTYRNRKKQTDLTSFSQKLCSNYPIIYYLSQMLKQPKPTDVIVSKKWELLLQILHTDTHSMFFHNIPGMSSSIAVQGRSLTKVFGLSSLMWSKRSLLSCTAVCWKMGCARK